MQCVSLDEIEWKVNKRFSHKQGVKLNVVTHVTAEGMELRGGWLTGEPFSPPPSFTVTFFECQSHPDVLKSDCKPYRRAFETFDNICAADTKKRPLVTHKRHVWELGKKEKTGKIQTPSEESLPLLWPIERSTTLEERPVRAVPAHWLGHNHTLKCSSNIVSIKWKLGA